MHTRSTKTMSPARIAQLVAIWRTSGEASAQFARRHGIHPRTFWGWCQPVRTAEAPAPVAAAAPTFVPVTVASDAGADAPMEILFASGDRLVVRVGAPSEWVRAVVMALRPPC
jgi:transposase-like protein